MLKRLATAAYMMILMGCITLATPLHADQSQLPAGEFMMIFHVAPGGSDANEGTASAPFATLERAREAVRNINRNMTGDILVAIHPGDYVLSRPLQLTSEDSGRRGFKVRWVGLGQPGSARLLGGVRLAKWDSLDDKIFRTRVEPGHVFHTLYEDGLRARKARFPNYEFDRRFPLSGARYLKAAEGTDTVLTWKPGDLLPIRNVELPEQANLIFWPWSYADWHKVTRQIGTIDFERGQLTVPEHEDCPEIGKQARYYIEGARGLLDQPGEFYLDLDSGTLDYWPRGGDPNEAEIIAPRLVRVISLEGQSEANPLRNVVIEGLAMGWTDTFATMTGFRLFPWTEPSNGTHGVVHLRYTHDVELRFNHIAHSGMNGIYLERSNKRMHIFGNWIQDMGISGICVGYHQQRKEFPEEKNAFNLIENNLIHGLGSIAVDSAGINIWGASDNTVRHCKIHDGARYGITIRGTFTQKRHGTGDDMGDTNRPMTENNLIELSHLHRLGQDSGDTGAVHMAGISSMKIHPVNTLNQLLIEDIAAHPSMQDIAPNGIFLDYPEGVTDQVLRDIEVRDTVRPFRTNNTDIRHTYDNVSWREDFDPLRMDYDRIGLLNDFPDNFGAPGEVHAVKVVEANEGGARRLKITWTNPGDEDLVGVRITPEGLAGADASIFPAAFERAFVPRPDTPRLVMLRIQTKDLDGNLSRGVLVPAAQVPEPVTNVRATGVDGGIQLEWDAPRQDIRGFRVTLAVPGHEPINLGPEARSAHVRGLQNARNYALHIDVVDRDGHAWTGTELRAAAGKGVPVPEDAAAFWNFDVSGIRAALSIGDVSGNGNTLFVGNENVGLTDGRFGKAVTFDGQTAYCRALSPDPLAIGTGDYAVSLWINQGQTGNLTERLLEFGGTGEPGLTVMANPTDVRVLFTAGETRYDPYFRGLEMAGQWMHVVINIDRDDELTIWVNGEKLVGEAISASVGVNIPPAPYFHLGRFKDNTNPKYNWTGAVDHMRVYQRALAPAEIIALYTEKP